jgi:hypothetical protein
MLLFIYCYAECHYAECHYTVCRYTECFYSKCRGSHSKILFLALLSNIRLGWKRLTMSSL